MLTYREALLRIFQRQDMERGPQPPYKERVWRLERVQALLADLGCPQGRYRSLHVAGTKGKGSTTAMLASILQEAGFRTGMYTSPHLHTFRERIRFQGQLIPEAEVARLVEQVTPVLQEHPQATVFELITALAMLYFAERHAEWAVFEVGLGGRLDATNVLLPAVATITSVSMDHMNVLGDTLEAIAREKAGIIKPRIPVVVAPQKPEALETIRAVAREREAPLIEVGRDWLWKLKDADMTGQTVTVWRCGHANHPEYPGLHVPLIGGHQIENACTAIATVERLREQGVDIPSQAVYRGIAKTRWPGRLEVLSTEPLIVVDGAHNVDSIRRMLEALGTYLKFNRLRLLFGVGRNHTPATLLELLLPQCQEVIVTQARHPKAVPADELVQLAKQEGYEVDAAPSVAEALQRLVQGAKRGELILVTGSLFVVAEAQEVWAAMTGAPPFPCDPPGVYG